MAESVVKNVAKVSKDDSDLPKASASVSRNHRRSADHSPLHPHYRAKLGSKGINGVSSPSWERKSSSDGNHGLAPLTPVKSRMKSTPRGNETPDMAASVPKFGDWGNDPSSADGYTQVFNRVREQREGGAGSTPSMSADNGHSLFKTKNSKGCCCCFPWGS